MLIYFLPSLSNFQFYLLSLLYNTHGHFSQSFLRNYLIQDYEIFDNFVFPLMASAGGGGGGGVDVSFAHFLLYFPKQCKNMHMLYLDAKI